MNTRIKMLRHMTGDETCWRNHYAIYSDNKTETMQTLLDMEAEGFVYRHKSSRYLSSGMVLFHATDEGKQLAWGEEESA